MVERQQSLMFGCKPLSYFGARPATFHFLSPMSHFQAQYFIIMENAGLKQPNKIFMASPPCVRKTRASTWFCPSRVGICLYGFSEAPFADHLLLCLLQMWKVLGENSGGCKDPVVAAEDYDLSGSL